MATTEKTGILTHIDAAGNKTLLYPVTIPDAVDGLAELLATKATPAQVNAAVKKAAPRNLLDNSDFRNPVNQRGQTSYSGSIFGIDRWRSWMGNNVTTVNNGYISVSARIEQYMSLEPNKTYTVAACKKDGTLYVYSGNPSVTGFGVWDSTVWCSRNSESGQLYVYLYAGDWLWAALYEGEYTAETLPEYQPKGYGVELAACERYYRKFVSPCIPWANNANGTTISGFLPIEMRIAPTVTFDSLYVFYDNHNYATITAGGAEKHTSGIKLNFTADSVISANGHGIIAGTSLILSADL